MTTSTAKRFWYADIDEQCSRCGHLHGHHFQDWENEKRSKTVEGGEMVVHVSYDAVNGCADCKCTGLA